MGTELASQGTGPRCRTIALHQSDVGVLTLTCVLDLAPDPDLGGVELVFVPRVEYGECARPLRHLRADDAAVLGATIRLWEGEEPLLPPGAWDLRVRLGAAGAQVPLLAPSYGSGTWPRVMVPAPTGPYRVSPSAEHGAMTLRVTQASPYVEVDRVDVEGAVLRLDGHLVPEAARWGSEGQLVVQRRDRKDVVVRLPVELIAGRLRAAVDLDALPSEEREDWDFYLRLDGESELRLGSHLDEIHDKARVFSFPWHVVDRSGKKLTVQAFYTAHNDLSVRVRVEASSHRDGTSGVASPKPATVRRPLGRRAKAQVGFVLSLVEIVGRLRRSRTHAGTRRRKVYFLVFHAHAMGGIVRTVCNLANNLAQDHDVEIISLVGRGKRPFFPIDPGVTLTFLADDVALRRSPPRGLKHPIRRVLHERTSWMVHERDIHFNRASLWLDLKLLHRLHRLEPGVLVTTTPSFNIIVARFARRGTVTLGQEHVNFLVHRNLKRQMRDHYAKLDALAVLTAGDEGDYRKLLSGSSTRILRIPNGLPRTATVRADLDSKRVIAAGRYTSQKGFDLLVPAYERVARKHPDWQLRVFGKGPRRGSLQVQASDLRLHNHVLFMGQTDQLAEELARSSIFVLSSRFEGFAMVVIEAMAVGLPVVSFDCPRGPSDIITDGVDGTLVPPGDVDALGAAILDLVENPDKRRAYSEAALRTARSYEIGVIGQVWRRTFDELLGPADQCDGPPEEQGPGSIQRCATTPPVPASLPGVVRSRRGRGS